MAPEIVAITNPTVNSFKRLHANATSSGATWAPNRISWGGNNRTNMVRIPDAPRLELRLADGAANPYLVQAAIWAAGMHGIQNKLDPSNFRSDLNMYTASEKDRSKFPLLPSSFSLSLLQLEQSQVM